MSNAGRCRARKVAVRATGSGLAVSLPSRIVKAISPIAIRTAVPKNGPRQELLPSAPPSSGPMAMPRPRAASYKITALSAAPREPPGKDQASRAKSGPVSPSFSSSLANSGDGLANGLPGSIGIEAQRACSPA